jgi:hypothetical protein
MKPLNQSDLCPDVWTSIGAELDWVQVSESGLTEDRDQRGIEPRRALGFLPLLGTLRFRGIVFLFQVFQEFLRFFTFFNDDDLLGSSPFCIISFSNSHGLPSFKS